MLVETDATKEAFDVECQDLLCFLSRKQPLKQSDQAAHQVGVAVGEKLDHAVRPGSLPGEHVNNALTALDKVDLGLQLGRQRRDLFAHLEDLMVTSIPVVKKLEQVGQLVGGRLRRRGDGGGKHRLRMRQ